MLVSGGGIRRNCRLYFGLRYKTNKNRTNPDPLIIYVLIQGAIKPGVYADDAARDAAITTPTAGMMVFNTTGTKFQGYTGAAWVDLN